MTTGLLTRALDPAVAPPSDATSERILDAALALAAASGIRNLTIDDVAVRAGVGRMTLYRRFGDKATLLDALAVRECRRCLAELGGAIRGEGPLEERVADGLVAGLRIAREHPLLNRLARHEPQAVLDALAADDGQVFAALRAFAALQLREGGAGGRLPVDVDELAEIFVRLGLSFVLIQDSGLAVDDDEAMRDLARRAFRPLLG